MDRPHHGSDGRRHGATIGLAGATRTAIGVLVATGMAVYVGREASPFAVASVLAAYSFGTMLFAPVWDAVAAGESPPESTQYLGDLPARERPPDHTVLLREVGERFGVVGNLVGVDSDLLERGVLVLDRLAAAGQ